MESSLENGFTGRTNKKSLKQSYAIIGVVCVTLLYAFSMFIFMIAGMIFAN